MTFYKLLNEGKPDQGLAQGNCCSSKKILRSVNLFTIKDILKPWMTAIESDNTEVEHSVSQFQQAFCIEEKIT